MSLGAKIIKNTGINLVGRVISTFLGVACVALLTRYLGPEQFGEYTTSTNFLQFFAIIADFGLTLTALTMLGEAKPEEERKLLGNLTSLRIVTMIFFTLAPLLVLLFPYSDTIKHAALVGAAAYAVLALNQMLISVFQKHLAMHVVAIAEVLGRAMLLGAMVVAAEMHLGVVAMVAAMLLANVVQVGTMLLIGYRIAPLHFEYDRAVWHEIVRRSWPLAASSALNLIYLKGDILILSLFRPQAEVGFYGAAYKVLDVLTVLPFMFMGLVLPRLAAAWKEGDKEKFRGYFQQSFEALVILGLPFMVGGVILSTKLMVLIAGAEFVSGGNLLGILLVALFCVFISSFFGHTAIALQAQRKTIWMYGVVALLTFAGYFATIPFYGATAAAWFTVFSEALIAILLSTAVRRAAGFLPTTHNFLKIISAVAVMGAVVFVMRDLPVLVTISAGAAVYGAAIVSLGLVPKRLLDAIRVKVGV
jgi:O-antigen/teichoic acid export membrane protein